MPTTSSLPAHSNGAARPALRRQAAPDAPSADDLGLGLGEMLDDRILGLDSAHVFMVSAQAVAARSSVVAEVGCGRGALVDIEKPGGAWQDLRGPGRTVVGIDIEDAGRDNPVIDEFRLIGGDGRWPLEDAWVDLAVSDFVLEHVIEPEAFVAELARVLRPGGMFISPHHQPASLLAAAARIVPNERHAQALARLQPGREERDVFRTAYKMNTRRDLARLLDPGFDWALARRTGFEQYFKPWPRLRRTVAQGERHLPGVHVDGAGRLRPAQGLRSGEMASAEQAVRRAGAAPRLSKRGVSASPIPAPAPAPASRRATGSRRAMASSPRVMVLTVVDQGASSVSNFALAAHRGPLQLGQRARRVRHPHHDLRAEPRTGAKPIE